MSGKQTKPGWVRALRVLVRFIVAVLVVAYTLLDELVFPILRPLVRWLTGFRIFQRIGEFLGRLPPYVALVTLGIPFVIIEPAKLVALWWAASGQVVLGTIALLVAEVLSLLVCERIFHAAYVPLMRIGWLKLLLDWLFGLRDRALAIGMQTSAWRWAVRMARMMRLWWRRTLGVFR